MRAYEIPDFLNKKIRDKTWHSSWWIKYMQGNTFMDQNDLKYIPSLSALSQDTWEEYKPKEQWYKHEYWECSGNRFVKKIEMVKIQWTLFGAPKDIPISVDQPVDDPRGKHE